MLILYIYDTMIYTIIYVLYYTDVLYILQTSSGDSLSFICTSLASKFSFDSSILNFGMLKPKCSSVDCLSASFSMPTVS